MWKCKECGGYDFYHSREVTEEYRGVNFDIYGNIESGDYCDNRDVTYEHFDCMECGNESSDIKDIAEWEE